AEQAQERYANQEALALYDQALALAEQLDRLGQLAPDDALRVYGQCGDALAATGAFDLARSRYAYALAGLGPDALDRQATLRRKIGSTHEQQGDWASALDWFTAAAENIGAAAPDHGIMVEYAQILSAIGWVHFRQGDLEQAGRNLEQALDLIRPLGVDNEEAGILNRLGGVAYLRGDMEQSRAYVEQSLAASERGGDLIAQATALGNLGNLTASQGLGEEAIRFYEQALALHEQTGSRRMLAITANNLGLSLRDVERYVEALQAVEQSHALAVEQRDRYTQMVTLGNSGRILALLGDTQAARRRLLDGQAMAEELGLVSDQIENHVALGELALQQGDLAAALAELERGRAIAADTGGEEYGRLQRLEARALWRQGDRAAALDLLRANVAFFRGLQNIPEARRSEKLLAALGDDLLLTRAT
ncbi:MAG TPA: tetratricopeptide repeat protein, partial [Herpetosiphonaceae bacterium]|nr:tetratricopeptide repeat protein [Herpetosiphonaceae bacterium]